MCQIFAYNFFFIFIGPERHGRDLGVESDDETARVAGKAFDIEHVEDADPAETVEDKGYTTQTAEKI
jgi:hypothetical protein